MLLHVIRWLVMPCTEITSYHPNVVSIHSSQHQARLMVILPSKNDVHCCPPADSLFLSPQKASKAPELSQEKRQKQEKPLDFLVQAAAVDPATKWRRVFQLGRCGLGPEPQVPLCHPCGLLRMSCCMLLLTSHSCRLYRLVIAWKHVVLVMHCAHCMQHGVAGRHTHLLSQAKASVPLKTIGVDVCVVQTPALLLLCSKSEILCVVKQPEGLEGPTHISLITDNANKLVLHWGTSKPGEHSRLICHFNGSGFTLQGLGVPEPNSV